jgi:hypothetical protein
MLQNICVTDAHGYVVVVTIHSLFLPASPITEFLTWLTQRSKNILPFGRTWFQPNILLAFHVAKSLVFTMVFCGLLLSFCPFSFGHRINCSASIEWVSDCCLTPKWAICHLFHGDNKLHSMGWYWCLVCSRSSWIFIVLAHWHNSPRVNMSLHQENYPDSKPTSLNRFFLLIRA